MRITTELKEVDYETGENGEITDTRAALSNDDDETEHGRAADSPRHHNYSPKTGRAVKRATLWRKWLHTLFIGLSFVTLGINVAIAGPTFLDILQILNVSVEGGSPLFTSGAIGYLVGSLICGFALEKVNHELLLFASMVGMGVFSIAIPWIASLPFMALARAIGNMFFGSIDTAGNAVCLQIWGADVGPYMQSIHFAYAAGGLLAPIIAQPFLVEGSNVRNATDNGSTPADNLNSVVKGQCDDSNCIQPPKTHEQPETCVQFAFLIAGSTAVVISFTFIYMYFKYKRHVKRNRTTEDDHEPEQQLTQISKILYLVLLAMFFAVYCGVEDTYASFLATFVVKYSGWSKSDASSVTSVFWGAFALARLLSIFIAKILSPWKMMLIDCVLVLLSLFLLCFLTHVTAVLWAASALMGISMASIFPSVFTWTEKNIMKVGGRIASLFLISASTGTMVNPLVVGYLFDHVTPMWLLWLLLGQTIFFVLIFVVLSILVKVRYGRIFVARQSRPMDLAVAGTLLEEQHRSQPIVIPD